jgi:hypothetical protein
MPKRSRIADKSTPKPEASPKRPKRDENKAAFDLVQKIIRETEGSGKNPLAVALGRIGGLKGGRARAEKLTREQRRASAVKAARARWEARK